MCGGGQRPDYAMEITQLLDDHVATDALGSARLEVVRFVQFQRAAQTTGESLVRLDLLRRRTGLRMRMGGISLELSSRFRARGAPLFAGQKNRRRWTVRRELGNRRGCATDGTL